MKYALSSVSTGSVPEDGSSRLLAALAPAGSADRSQATRKTNSPPGGRRMNDAPEPDTAPPSLRSSVGGAAPRGAGGALAGTR